MTRARIEDAFAFMAAGDVPQAVSVLQALSVQTPAHATVHVLLAQGYERLHRWPEALEAWQAAALLLPDAVVVRQGSLRATRVLAALRTMAEERAYVSVGTPTGPNLVPIESPRIASDEPSAADPLATLSATTTTRLTPVEAVPVAAADVPDQAVHVAPPLSARPYMPPPPTAAPDPAPPTLEGGLDTFLGAAHTDAPRSAWQMPAPEAKRPLDLDKLIGEIEKAGPIRPRPDLDAIAPPDLDDEEEDPVSETLARIYAGQGQFAQALRIYERLAERHPDEAARFLAEADALRPKVTV